MLHRARTLSQGFEFGLRQPEKHDLILRVILFSVLENRGQKLTLINFRGVHLESLDEETLFEKGPVKLGH